MECLIVVLFAAQIGCPFWRRHSDFCDPREKWPISSSSLVATDASRLGAPWNPSRLKLPATRACGVGTNPGFDFELPEEPDRSR